MPTASAILVLEERFVVAGAVYGYLLLDCQSALAHFGQSVAGHGGKEHLRRVGFERLEAIGEFGDRSDIDVFQQVRS